MSEPLVIAWYPASFGESTIREIASLASVSVTIVGGEHSPPGCNVLIDGRPSLGHLQSCPHLATLVIPFAGVPLATRELMSEFPHIAVYNLHHNCIETAETAVALLCACAKRLPLGDRNMREGNWSIRYEPTRTIRLAGKTALVVGFGAIGQIIAKTLVGAGMNVIATRKTATEISTHEGVDVFPSTMLRDLLPRANALVLAVPQTSETEGMIGTEELLLLPENAILINVARAQIVEEEALYGALKSGALHSAGLDVWYGYPQPGDAPQYFTMPDAAKSTQPSSYPFWELENVVMSPHRGGASADTEPSRAAHLARLLDALANGQQPPNRVDIARGY